MFKRLIAIYLFTAACTGLPFAGFSGGGHAQQTQTQTETSSSHTEETINGKSVAQRDDDDDHPAHKKAKHEKKDDIGKTCHHNDECGADACFVGAGDLGYCTKMCNSWSECPTHWECKRAHNAPQRICMQDAD